MPCSMCCPMCSKLLRFAHVRCHAHSRVWFLSVPSSYFFQLSLVVGSEPAPYVGGAELPSVV
jgi:hypothetical protein